VAEGREKSSNKYAAKKAATERIAVQRAAQQRAERRRNIMVVGGASVAVLVVIGIIVAIGVSSKKSTSSGNAVVAASSTVTNAISSAATSTLNATPDFSGVTGPPSKINAPALTSGGKPEVLYIGAEYCPYCAATRWPLAVALARFGTFSNLKTTYSLNSDQAGPHTPTLSFYGSSYTSQYIDFVSVENEDGVGNQLQSVTSEQQNLWQTYGSTNGQTGYPFIDFAGAWKQSGASYNPLTLKGMTPDSVAATLGDTSSKVGTVIQGNADIYTAIICEATKNQPSNVCTAPAVTTAESRLNGSS
jgi:thiol-disulfide isomerase/thioredoxin